LDAAETERYVGDLEIAVDRLRSLYEQYFMGIEKLEPTVPRKDVDRRIHVLRKEQIRNTAQRFRFQMILQKYNTYQTHWMRICREIENGTYKRHLLKARQRFGDDKPRATPPPSAPAVAAAGPAKAALAQPGVPAKNLAAELAELDEEFGPMLELDDDDLEAIDGKPARTATPATPAAAAPKPAARAGGPVWRKAEPAAPRAPSVPPPTPSPAAPAPRAAPGLAAPVRTAAASGPRPAGPASPVRPAAAPAPAPPAVARPAAPAPAAAPRPVAAPPPAARAAGDIPDERVRQLYAQYVETKRQQRESTAAITFEAVAKSLRDSSAKLREKHGKNVDFEVSVKDGKTVLKPVLK
jgi:hypothetical protein